MATETRTAASSVPTKEERQEAAARGMILALHARYAPDRPAIISDAGNRSFGELNANANASCARCGHGA